MRCDEQSWRAVRRPRTFRKEPLKIAAHLLMSPETSKDDPLSVIWVCGISETMFKRWSNGIRRGQDLMTWGYNVKCQGWKCYWVFEKKWTSVWLLLLPVSKHENLSKSFLSFWPLFPLLWVRIAIICEDKKVVMCPTHLAEDLGPEKAQKKIGKERSRKSFSSCFKT